MKRLSRVTPATLDVLAVLVWSPEDLHGFALAKAAGRPTGSVYVILNRLEEAGMVDSYWEPVNTQHEGRPRRRFYRLNPDGLGAAREILAERNHQAQPKSATSKGVRSGIRLDSPGGAR
jgi:PadR family transcriptional regulator